MLSFTMMIERNRKGAKRAMDHKRSAKHSIVRSDTSFSKADGTYRHLSGRHSHESIRITSRDNGRSLP